MPNCSRDPANAGALAFKRTGDPNMGSYGDGTILKQWRSQCCPVNLRGIGQKSQ
jgi:hypothetical protein